ncbi:MAG: Gfo/Idh/MocA family oxidoreductase [Acidimicrobiales bacterium]|nr:Gfo/Idh/MocA family oxidoreductase [Acidimicrobiales bacterium]
MTQNVGVALLGYGYWGANLARNVRAARNLTLVGVADPSADQRSAAEAALPGIATWDSLGGALADDRVEAVVIAAPASLHATLAQEALAAGRHVMVEKPLANTYAEALAIGQAAKDAGLIAMVGHTFLYSPPVWRLKELVASGELGTPQYLYSQRLSLGRVRRDCNALWNFAPHDISIMLHLLDERPVEVSGTSMTMIDPANPDVFFAKLQFPSGVGAHLHVSWIDPRKTRLMTIVGDQKMVVYDDVSVDQKIAIVDSGMARTGDLGSFESLGDFQWRTRAGDILIPRVEMTEPLRNEMEAFGHACLTGETPAANADHGADVVAILAAIDASARRGGSPQELSW